MELLLIRHGRPLRTEPDASTAPDPQLSPSGHDQARAVAEWLAGEPIDAIYSSSMRRAAQTAEPLAARLGMPVQVDHDLRELSFGEDVYIPMEELAADHPLVVLWNDVVADHDSVAVRAFRARVGAGLGRIVRNHPGQSVAVFCHGGVVSAAACELLGLSGTLIFDVDYASISRIRVSRSGRHSIHTLNEQGHLRKLAPLKPAALKLTMPPGQSYYT